MAKLSSLLKNEAPGRTVTVSLPAFIKSASISDSAGNGPSPKIPFSDCKVTLIPFGMKLLASIGMPIPKLAATSKINRDTFS